MRHWLAAGESGPAGAIVCRSLEHYTRCARYETIRRWLEMFSDEQILGDQSLTLTAGVIGPMTGDPARSRVWISAALRMQVGDGMWAGSSIPLRALQATTRAIYASEGVTQMRADAELAVTLGEGAQTAESAAAVIQLGIARWLGGDNVEGALRVLREGEEQGAAANVLAQIAAIGFQALILADEGRWAEATRRTGAGLQRVDEAGPSWGLPTLPLLLAQARLQAHDRDPSVHARVALIGEIVAQGLPTYLALLSEVLVGELLLEFGDLAEATRWMHAGFARLATWPDAGILRPRLQRPRERLEQLQLLEPLTPAERRVLELLPTELSLKEIARRLWVSPETVRTHVRDIYRKLEVHSRSEAVARARELDLLVTS